MNAFSLSLMYNHARGEDMDLIVKDALALSCFDNSQLLAGKTGVYNVVSDVIVMEAHDVEVWLKPGQMVLSSLYSLKGSSRHEFKAFIHKLKELGASAIVVKMGRFVNELSSGIIEGCDQYDLPLVLIDETVAYRDIILKVMQTLINKKANMLDIYQTVHHEFKELAMREPKKYDVLVTLKKLIGKEVSLLNQNHEILEKTEKRPGNYKLINRRKLFGEQYMHYTYYRELIESDNGIVSFLVCEIPLMEGKKHFLTIKEEPTFAEMIDYMAIENAASMLQFESIKELSLKKAKQSHKNDLFDFVINGKYQNLEELHENALGLKLSLNKKYRVITWMHVDERYAVGDRNFREHNAYMALTQNILDNLQAVWPRFAYRIFSNRITFIIEDNFNHAYAFKNYIEETLMPIYEKYKQQYVTLRVGISELGELNQIPRLAPQPLRIVQLSSMVNRETFIILYRDLGIYRILMGLSKENSLDDYVSDTLRDLNEKDEEYLLTLRVFLDCNQNYKKASEILFVHPKTVRYRIEKIKEYSGLNFDDAEDMLHVQIELRIMDLLDNEGINLG